MKGSSLKIFLGIVITVATIVFIYVAVLTEIKNMNKERLNKIESLNEKQNRTQALMVEIQKLSAEDRVVKFAIETLKMERPVDNLESISVSKEQIQQIEKILNNKYD
ncbi:MAG: cell division protein FtsL [Melioribacteraceae bacterium]|jgi:cell division protein FtsL|nr:cell division protein FtsL [Melioribacteraceae bacterium]